MRAKIKAGGHESPYRLRKQLPEPVFRQIKKAGGFRQFLLRGFESVRAEWAMVCTAHNLRKLAHRLIPSAASAKAVARPEKAGGRDNPRYSLLRSHQLLSLRPSRTIIWTGS